MRLASVASTRLLGQHIEAVLSVGDIVDLIRRGISWDRWDRSRLAVRRGIPATGELNTMCGPVVLHAFLDRLKAHLLACM